VQCAEGPPRRAQPSPSHPCRFVLAVGHLYAALPCLKREGNRRLTRAVSLRPHRRKPAAPRARMTHLRWPAGTSSPVDRGPQEPAPTLRCHSPLRAGRSTSSDTTTRWVARTGPLGCGGGQGTGLCQRLGSGLPGSSLRELVSGRPVDTGGRSTSERDESGPPRGRLAACSGRWRREGVLRSKRRSLAYVLLASWARGGPCLSAELLGDVIGQLDRDDRRLG
jgi:hypothetical protein